MMSLLKESHKSISDSKTEELIEVTASRGSFTKEAAELLCDLAVKNFFHPVILRRREGLLNRVK